MGVVVIQGERAVGGVLRRPAGHPRRRRALRIAAAAAAAVVLVPTMVVAGSWGWVHLSTAGRRYDVAAAPPRPVAVVFGASVRSDGTPSEFLAGRLDVARRLWSEGKVSVILVSGDNRARNYDEPTAMRRYLVRAGVPAGVVVRDPAGYDTWSTCVRARDVYGVSSAVLVSQSYHLPRALSLCRNLGLDAVGVGSETGRGTTAWRRGTLREVVADVEAVWEMATHPAPAVPGPPSGALTDALAGVGR